MGKYGEIEILKADEKLYYNSVETELLQETKFFRADDNNRTIEFLVDKSGNYYTLILTKGGVRETVKKNIMQKSKKP